MRLPLTAGSAALFTVAKRHTGLFRLTAGFGQGTTETFSPREVQGVCPKSDQNSCVFVVK